MTDKPKFRLKSQDMVGLPQEMLKPNPEGVTYKPIEPIECKHTGRTLTEWFEFPEFTDDEIRQMALVKAELEKPIGKHVGNMTYEELQKNKIYVSEINKHKRKKYRNGLTKVDVANRLNEASKMVDETNPKYLDKATQERTGLEINPLWQLEVLARSGTLTPKDQLAAWSKLAEHTHSKAATITKTETTLTMDQLLQDLAKKEYPVIDITPASQKEIGSGEKYLLNHRARKAAQEKEIQEAEYDDFPNDNFIAGIKNEEYSDDTDFGTEEDTDT